MKKKLLTIGIASTALITIPFLAGCGGFTPGENEDSSKTQLYISNFNRGFGGEWLANYKKEFEALHANDSYETGKKGVQIIIQSELSPMEGNATKIKTGKNEIFFTEQTDYYSLKAYDAIGDLTDCVKGTIAGENKSIEDKLTDDQKSYLSLDGHYYAIPHYTGYFGLTYDVDLFEKKLFYFDKTGNDFVLANDKSERSAGPDGLEGTSDDGLPVTYEQFLKLCKYMTDSSLATPWVAPSLDNYMSLLINSFVTANVGFDQMNLCYSCNGTLTDLIDIANDKKTVVSRPNQQITNETGYLFHHKRGIYDGLNFYAELFNKYLLESSKSTGYNVSKAHRDFLRSNISGANEGLDHPIAMIAEGNWWVNEASAEFENYASTAGEQYSKQKRNLAFMPLPKMNVQEGVNDENTIFDHLSAISFIKKGIPEWKMPLVNQFLQFCNSDASLISFTTTTNTMKALKYTIPEDKLATMSPYGQSLYNIQKNAKIVNPYCNSDYFRSHSDRFDVSTQYTAKINGSIKNHPYQSILDGVSAEEYFQGIYTYFEDLWK